ncbi:MFS transporter [Paenibacillus macquariensis]|uniref:Predicted arabinose efflux permease, MFS family n=1 Tax=Paenibacillus macquariensis TaxID=948756 RepID=A0ABY1K4F2_9BACL|nr:MFS transporter [Paenibacillus macquariensis]MEC0088983.1 MFS transporter [Paenibacillus macquariensis]OAB31876.1 MFS transporter [Paenibacillus macquariensis subsp. macquariensis]SIR23956.1 Predicted arabinose efflux permease, MFS family [Paenibacillus macquariensis]
MNATWFKEPKYAWVGLGSLWIIGFIGALTRFSMSYFQVNISEDLDISRGFISMAWSTNALITALCAPLGGWLVDRYGAKKVLLISSVMGTLGTGIVVIGEHPSIFFIGYAVISGLAGIGTTTTYLLMFEWFSHHRAKAMALLTSANSVGLAITTPIFVSQSWLTWKDAFLTSFILSLLISLPVIWLGVKGHQQNSAKKDQVDGSIEVENHNHDKQETVAPSLKRASHLPIFFLVGIALFTCGINMGTVEMNLVAIHQLANVSPSMIALSMSILGILEIVGSVTFGFLLDRFNKLVMMAMLFGIRIMGFAILFMHVGWSPILFAIAFGMTYLSVIPGGILIFNEYAEGKGKQTGFLFVFHQAGSIMGTLIGGLSFDYFKNYQVLIGFDVVICILVTLGFVALFIFRRRSHRLHNVHNAKVSV